MNFYNYHSTVNSELRKRNKELFTLSIFIITLITILWMFVGKTIIDVLLTCLILWFYIAQVFEILDYHDQYVS